jgi:hypothetical protein
VQAVAGEQGAHAAAPLANVPTGHEAAVNSHDKAPCGLKSPLLQGWQSAGEELPTAEEKVPAEQGAHAEGAAAPTLVLYEPPAQGVHAVME